MKSSIMRPIVVVCLLLTASAYVFTASPGSCLQPVAVSMHHCVISDKSPICSTHVIFVKRLLGIVKRVRGIVRHGLGIVRCVLDIVKRVLDIVKRFLGFSRCLTYCTIVFLLIKPNVSQTLSRDVCIVKCFLSSAFFALPQALQHHKTKHNPSIVRRFCLGTVNFPRYFQT